MKWNQQRGTRSRRLPRRSALWIGILAGAAAMILVPVVGEGLRAGEPSNPQAATHVPDANSQSEIEGNDSKSKDPEAASAARKKMIADDSEQLLKLATDLKSEVDKTDKDTLSISVIRKAGAIEKLAHDVKEKMKPSAGPG
jgi:hypothetical protein